MQLKKAHQAGPLPANFPRCEQFKEFHLTNFKLKCSQGNDAVLVNKDIFIIQNVIVVNGTVGLICRKFRTRDALYDYPIDSRDINISLVRDLGHQLMHIDMGLIDAKIILLPMQNGFAAFPMIHTQYTL